ncbi:MAG: hypothetical protein Q7K03_00535 [Dehalococcoidia bacterium]|nr:hypothetical protein [Dehalococcoidia bacterium]
MAGWKDMLPGDPLPWLLEREADQPAVRHFAFRDLLDREEDGSDIQEARAVIMSAVPVHCDGW